ncbi:hypothetical protein [Hymenobacter glacieicola]|uniref:Uncharacterized protein n=1 Tax=Hymenobacter glacieicola TaxID=1562124 RepID=A0ABQ1X6P6_9BACT|nr:hypothetical protein [Hymenobacter glacieicola]GGG61302.1 hypothetical protein GCM10011378_41660 [Hymenobacter glacieicola]
MKLKTNDYIGLIMNSPAALEHLKGALSDAWPELRGDIKTEDSARETLRDEKMFDSLFSRRAKSYLILNRALEVILKISVSDKFDLSIVQQLHRKSVNLLFGKDLSLRYDIIDNQLVVNAVKRVDGSDFETNFSWVDLSSELGPQLKTRTEGCISRITLAIQMILFLELTEPELLVVKAGKKSSARPIGYTNDGDCDVTLVDSTWNKYIIRTEGFGVSGHFRAQRHGEKNSEIKLIWIQPFQKHGYVRKPKS